MKTLKNKLYAVVLLICGYLPVLIDKDATIMQMNVDKLKARYPDGFDAEHSLHRDQDDI